jgi:hypothetical protein
MKEIGHSKHKCVFFVVVYGVYKRNGFHPEYRSTISYKLATFQQKSTIRWYSKFNFSIQNVRWENTDSSDRQFECTCFSNTDITLSTFVKFRINGAKINFMSETKSDYLTL